MEKTTSDISSQPAPGTTAKRKWLVRLIVAVFLIGAGYVVWFSVYVRSAMHECYAEWTAGELVIRYYEQHNRLPDNWQELESAWGDGRGLHNVSVDFSNVKEWIEIGFPRLAELQILAQREPQAKDVPKIIRLKNGKNHHWQGAEPNHLIYEYFLHQKDDAGPKG